MRRTVFAIGLTGLLAACGQQAQPAGEGGAPAAALDYIDAVPIDKNAPPPVAEPQTAAKKEEPEEAEKEPEAAEPEAAEAPATTAPPAPEPAPKVDDAAAATRRANETPTPYEATPRPD